MAYDVELRAKKVLVPLINGGASSLENGDVVVFVTGDPAKVQKTTTASHDLIAGVVSADSGASIAQDQLAFICVSGITGVKVTGAVTAGNLLETSTTAGYARDAGGSTVGGFLGRALEENTSGTNVINATIQPYSLNYSAADVSLQLSYDGSVMDLDDPTITTSASGSFSIGQNATPTNYLLNIVEDGAITIRNYSATDPITLTSAQDIVLNANYGAGNVTISGLTGITGNTDVTGTFEVVGASTFDGVTIDSALDVNSTTSLGGAVTVETGNSVTIVSGNLGITSGNISLSSGTISSSGNISTSAGNVLASSGYMLSPTIHGSTSSGGTLTLSSTTHATKGKINFGSGTASVFDEVEERIGINYNAPITDLHIGDKTVSSILESTFITGRGICVNVDTAAGRIYVAGNQQADIVLVDDDATADQRTIQMKNAGGRTEFKSIQDDGDSQVENILVLSHGSGNVGIGAIANDEAILDISSVTKAVVFPKIPTASLPASTPETGMMAYDSTTNTFKFYNGSTWGAMGGGAISSVSNGADNRVATFSSSDSLNGEANLTFDGTILEIRAEAASPGSLTLSTSELTVVDGDILGRIDFQAPEESSGTDAILVGASIWAEADATFDVTVNSTDLVFATGDSATASEKMRIDSTGIVTIANLSGNSLVKSSSLGVLSNASAGVDYQAVLTNPITGNGSGSDNQIATYTGTNAIQPESNLTYNGTTLTIAGASGGLNISGATSTITVLGLATEAAGDANDRVVVANTTTGSLKSINDGNNGDVLTLNSSTGIVEWSAPTGGVDTSGSPAVNQVAYFADSNTIQGMTAAASSVLVTNGSNVPSLSTNIPTAVTIGGAYVYRVSGTDVSLADGGTGTSLGNGTSYQILKSDADGTVTWIDNYYTLNISVPGELTTGTNVLGGPLVVPFSCTIVHTRCYINTAPTGANMLIDINRNGTRVFASDSDRLTITAGANSDTSNTFAAAEDDWTAGDRLSIDIDQVGSTIAGSNLGITVVFKRTGDIA